MLNQPVMEKLLAMRLQGMVEALKTQEQDRAVNELSFLERLALRFGLECPIAAFNVLVVFLDRLLSDLPRVEIVVVQVRHHLRRDPHGSTVVDPLLGVQHGHDQQRNRRAQAVLEVRVSHARIQKHLSPFFDPRAVIEIAWIELLQQKLVPGVAALVQRTRLCDLTLPLGLRTPLAVLRRLGLRPLLRGHANEAHKPRQCEDDNCECSLLLHIASPCSRRTRLFFASLYRPFSPNCYICRSHCATARGSKRTAVPTRKLGSLWAFASL